MPKRDKTSKPDNVRVELAGLPRRPRPGSWERLPVSAWCWGWACGCGCCVSRAAALVAPVFVWVGSAAGIWESTKERGFYGVAIVVAAAALLVALRLHDRAGRADVVAAGLLVGIGLWTTPLLVAAIIP